MAAHEQSAMIAEYREALRSRRSVVAQLSRDELLQIQAEFSALPEISGGPGQIGMRSYGDLVV